MKLYEQSYQGLSNSVSIDALKQAAAQVKSDQQKGLLPVLDGISSSRDLESLKPLCQQFQKKFRQVIVLGIGGSSLGGKMLCDLVQSRFTFASTPYVHFVDNIDPHTLDALFNTFNPQDTGFLVISKSGTTAETLCQFLVALDFMRQVARLKEHFIIISEEKDTPMKRLATRFDLPFFKHHPNIGGRFSVLSLVGLLPALLAGVDCVKLRKGAQRALDDFLTQAEQCLPAQGAAFMHTSEQNGYATHVLMPYCDRLISLSHWHRQLWAESLGKEGKGTTPLAALGTSDQHSQLQQFLEGKQDKFFTLVMLDQSHQGPLMPADLTQDPDLNYLHGARTGDLMQAEQRATLKSLQNHGCPTRVLTLKTLNEETLGALIMHFILETMLTAHLMNVNAFDQPAVEESKVLTRLYLKEARLS